MIIESPLSSVDKFRFNLFFFNIIYPRNLNCQNVVKFELSKRDDVTIMQIPISLRNRSFALLIMRK